MNTALAQWNRATGNEPVGREFESLRQCQNWIVIKSIDYGLKVFMDAHGPVKAKESGSLPAGTARIRCSNSKYSNKYELPY
jgi:hypothetical protein